MSTHTKGGEWILSLKPLDNLPRCRVPGGCGMLCADEPTRAIHEFHGCARAGKVTT